MVVSQYIPIALPAGNVTGLILVTGAGTLTIDSEAATVCGVAADSPLVQLADAVEILTVIITDDAATIIPGGVPAAVQEVGMTGTCEGGDFHADNLVIVRDNAACRAPRPGSRA